MLEGGKGYGDLPSAGSGRRKIRMSAQENKALARRWVEGLFNEGNLDVADEIDVSWRCTDLQIPHEQRVLCSLPCPLLQGIASGLGSN